MYLHDFKGWDSLNPSILWIINMIKLKQTNKQTSNDNQKSLRFLTYFHINRNFIFRWWGIKTENMWILYKSNYCTGVNNVSVRELFLSYSSFPDMRRTGMGNYTGGCCRNLHLLCICYHHTPSRPRQSQAYLTWT